MTYSPLPDPTKALLDMLDLADSGGARTLEDIFVGHSVSPARGRVYGGQVLAQAVTAAMRTVEPERIIHSLHAYFLRAGDVDRPITFGVERIRDGRSFSARRVHAYQDGRAILSAIASFQLPARGLEHQDESPRTLPDPESLPSAAQLLGHIDAPEARAVAHERPFDVRYITEPIYFTPDSRGEPYNAVWLKTLKPLPDDSNVHRAALAYASDYTLFEPVLRMHGKTWTEPGMNLASLDHAMWWHREARADEWILYVQSSPNASSARGLGVGRMFTRDGLLIATVAQEGMMRFPEFQEQPEVPRGPERHRP